MSDLPIVTPGMGRLIEFDERSRNYPVRLLLGESRPIITQDWPCPIQLDQGVLPHCVGFSWAQELAADPIAVQGRVWSELATSIYHHAQTLDQWEGEDYEGTSVLAGAKAVQARGFMPEYRWAFSLEDVLESLCYLGPVVVGTNWYSSMFTPDERGFVWCDGEWVGGHAYLLNGINQYGWVSIHNSWGNWRADMTFATLDRLLREDGEAVIPIVRLNGETPTPEPTPPDIEPAGCWPKAMRWLSK